ncbi:hypothetical protein ACWF95_36555 [Streptomyces vinaceus]
MSNIPNTQLRMLLHEANWNGAQLAAAVRRIAAEQGQHLVFDRSTISRWLSGTTPRPPAPALLLEALSRRLRRPVSAAEAGLSHVWPPTDPDPASASDPLRRLTQLTRADLDPRHRWLNTGHYSPVTLTALAAGQPPAEDSPRTLTPSSRAHVQQMHSIACLFADAAQLHGPRHIRTALTAYLSHDVTRYLKTPTTDTSHHALLTQTAQLTLLLGTICAGDGADALAQHYHRTAAQLASQANDPATFAIALRTMSAHAHDLGHHTPAILHLAERAADAARNTTPAIRAYTQAHLAVIQAHHDKHAALAALASAEHSHAQARDSLPGPFTHYPIGALHYQRAQVLATLGDKSGTISALTTSLRLRTPAERQATALTRARLAETLLAQGHLDAALTHWHTFLHDYHLLDSAPAHRRLLDMRRRLLPYRRHPATASLLNQAASL